MWSPTHIQVTVQKAKGLLTKGKNGTNNCFVTIGLGKEKYQTSVKEKADSNVSWNEECELKIPDQGNRAELTLTCLHRNNLGIDEFLGQVTLPLNEMDVYDRPRSKWFRLESKPGKEKKNKERGELEVRVSFVVKSGSLTDLSKKDKHKSSIGQLASSVGGSLLSIGQIEKRKGIKKFAKSLGSKMHLNGKKKNKDGGDDASSFSGSFASIGTPNSGSRYGQRAGEADPGVISEDEDEFVFDNLSHKSSGSSLNVRGLQPPSTGTQSYVPRNPSPLLSGSGLNGKAGGKQQRHSLAADEEDLPLDPELEALESDFSVRARTLPPPSKPPRTPQLGDVEENAGGSPQITKKEEKRVDEWASKLYGKQLEVGSSDSLKRRSWELAPVPLPQTDANLHDREAEIEGIEEKVVEKTQEVEIRSDTDKIKVTIPDDMDTTSTSSSEESEQEQEPLPLVEQPAKRPQELKLSVSPKTAATTLPKNTSLLSPDAENGGFDQFNASFAKFEQRNSAIIFDANQEEERGSGDDNPKWKTTQNFIAQESIVPQPTPRNRSDKDSELKKREIEREREVELQKKQAEEQKERAVAEERRIRALEDARLEAELRRNEEQERVLQEELRVVDEQNRREAKRREEDQMILSFAKRSISQEDEVVAVHEEEQEIKATTIIATPSPPTNGEKREKRLNKFKMHFSNKRDESPSPKSNERIIIGHERSSTHAERRSEITAALAKKYDGKSREELMLIANGMENEALLQRQRVKELEDYLDNLLLRVMETHPKILQNPYSRTTSAKSFKNYINMNDFL